MKVLILAGGLGTRLNEITKVIPKPMVKIKKYPIIIYVMLPYIKFGYCDFIIALGYKGEKILEFFLKKKINNLIKKKIKKGYTFKKKIFGKICNITFLETGKKTMTGGRIKRATKLLDNDFFLTYGDGVSNINIENLKKFHFKQKKLVTVTAVNPPARFGEIIFSKNKVINFSEKKRIKNTWINGGFFVINKKFIKYLKNDKTILERDPLEKVAKINQLAAFKHHSLWQCLDTKRDISYINTIIDKI